MSEIKVNILSQRRRLMLLPLWGLMRLWTRTLRVEVGPEDRVRLCDVSRPTVIVLWHNRVFLAPELYRAFRRPRITYGLVSASKDGAWLAAFLDLIGLRAVRGSSSRGGREALVELISSLREGHDVAITPDGPRGPMYSFKPGASVLIRRSGARVLLVGFRFRKAWRFKSWDQFYLPRPFSVVQVVTEVYSPEALPRDLEGCAEKLRESLLALNAE